MVSTGSAGSNLTIETGNLQNCDTVLELYKADSQEALLFDDNSGGDWSSRLEYWLADDDYLLCVRNKGEDGGTYTLKWNIWTPDKLSICSLSSEPQQCEFNDSQQSKWFRVTGCETEQLAIIKTTNLKNCDTMLELYAADGQTNLFSDDDSGSDDWSSLLEYPLEKNKEYLLCLLNRDSDKGSCNLEVVTSDFSPASLTVCNTDMRSIIL